MNDILIFFSQPPILILCSLMLPIMSVGGVWLSTSKKYTTRYLGFISCLLSQVFWFYVAYYHKDLGLFINSVFFSMLWLYRIHEYRLTKEK